MIYEVMSHCRNFFPTQKKFIGKFNIANRTITLDLAQGQYFLIEGSVLNDGVYQYPCTTLNNEEFDGVITALAVPAHFVALVNEITTYNEILPATSCVSESFGNYSRTRASKNGSVLTWQDAYKKRLDVYRKL